MRKEKRQITIIISSTVAHHQTNDFTYISKLVGKVSEVQYMFVIKRQCSHVPSHDRLSSEDIIFSDRLYVIDGSCIKSTYDCFSE